MIRENMIELLKVHYDDRKKLASQTAISK